MCIFFQAEDGIRDYKVTGVQTCALPIFGGELLYAMRVKTHGRFNLCPSPVCNPDDPSTALGASGAGVCEVPDEAERSEERRVGKGWRTRGASQQEKKTKESSYRECSNHR